MATQLAQLVVEILAEHREANRSLDTIQKRLEDMGRIKHSIPLEADPDGALQRKLGEINTSYLQILSVWQRHLDNIAGKIPVIGGFVQSLLASVPSLRQFVDQFMRLSDNLTRLGARATSFGFDGHALASQFYEVTRSLQDMGLSYGQAQEAVRAFSMYTTDPGTLQKMTQQAISIARAFEIPFENAQRFIQLIQRQSFADAEGILQSSLRYQDLVRSRYLDMPGISPDARMKQILPAEMQRGWGQQAAEMNTFSYALQRINNQLTNIYESATRLFGGTMAGALRTIGQFMEVIGRALDRFVLSITDANGNVQGFVNTSLSLLNPISWIAKSIEFIIDKMGGWNAATVILEREFRLFARVLEEGMGGAYRWIVRVADRIAAGLGFGQLTQSWESFSASFQKGWDYLLAGIANLDKNFAVAVAYMNVFKANLVDALGYLKNYFQEFFRWLFERIGIEFGAIGKKAGYAFLESVAEAFSATMEGGGFMSKAIQRLFGLRDSETNAFAVAAQMFRDKQTSAGIDLDVNRRNQGPMRAPGFETSLETIKAEKDARAARAIAGEAMNDSLQAIRSQRISTDNAMKAMRGPDAKEGGRVPDLSPGRPSAMPQYESIFDVIRRMNIASFGTGATVQDRQLTVQQEIRDLLKGGGPRGADARAAAAPLMMGAAATATALSVGGSLSRWW